MAQVFISYARKDQDVAESLAIALEQLGLSVWWDRELRGGEQFPSAIERQLAAARCVLVIWSKEAQSSDWVLREALYGLQHNKLVATTLDGVPAVKPFDTVHTVSLNSALTPLEPVVKSVFAVVAPFCTGATLTDKNAPEMVVIARGDYGGDPGMKVNWPFAICRHTVTRDEWHRHRGNGTWRPGPAPSEPATFAHAHGPWGAYRLPSHEEWTLAFELRAQLSLIDMEMGSEYRTFDDYPNTMSRMAITPPIDFAKNNTDETRYRRYRQELVMSQHTGPAKLRLVKELGRGQFYRGE